MSLRILIVIVSSLLASCSELPRGLDEYCPDTPLIAHCPDEGCSSGDFPCVAYCIETYPEGQVDLPETGMGSWCDAEVLPDYGQFCRERSEVTPCEAWCTNHPGSCEASEVDADADADVDSGVDADMEPPECSDDEDCADEIECSVDVCNDDGQCEYDLDVDDDGVDCRADCDDTDENNFPGNSELCDGVDNNCDGAAEEDFAFVVDGSDLDVAGEPTSLSLSWGGDVYAVAWCTRASEPEEDRSPYVALLRDDGSTFATGPITGGGDGCYDISVTWNGETFVVVWVTGSALLGAEIQTEGAFGAASPLIDGVVENVLMTTSFNGVDRYGFVGKPSTPEHILFTSFDGDLSWPEIYSEIGEDITENPALAAGQHGFLVVVKAEHSSAVAIEYWGFNRSGTMEFDGTMTTGSDILASPGVASVGDGFVMSWINKTSDTSLTAVADPTGTTSPWVVVSESLSDYRDFAYAHIVVAQDRGSSPGAGLVFTSRKGGDRALSVLRLDERGAPVDEPLDLPMVDGANGPEEFAASPSAHGVAVIWVETIAANSTLLFSSIETCFP